MPDPTPTAPATFDGLCDVCEERPAKWMCSAFRRNFVVCTPCRDGEPCARCGVERDVCACAAGPDITAWLPLAGEG